jgi:hypothetical protein
LYKSENNEGKQGPRRRSKLLAGQGYGGRGEYKLPDATALDSEKELGDSSSDYSNKLIMHTLPTHDISPERSVDSPTRIANEIKLSSNFRKQLNSRRRILETIVTPFPFLEREAHIGQIGDRASLSPKKFQYARKKVIPLSAKDIQPAVRRSSNVYPVERMDNNSQVLSRDKEIPKPVIGNPQAIDVIDEQIEEEKTHQVGKVSIGSLLDLEPKVALKGCQNIESVLQKALAQQRIAVTPPFNTLRGKYPIAMIGDHNLREKRRVTESSNQYCPD